MRRATSSARARFLPNTAADSPYSVSFARSTASSTDFTRVMETCGPADQQLHVFHDYFPTMCLGSRLFSLQMNSIISVSTMIR